MLLCASGPIQQTQTGTITGQVVDAGTGLPLSNIPVHLTGSQAAVTDRDGRFHLEHVPPGRRTLSVSVVGYSPFKRQVAIGAGGSIYIAIPLVGGTGTYAERVEVIGDPFRQSEAAVPAQQLLNSADLLNLRGLVLDDPVRTLQVLPGVAATDDFAAEFSVRGAAFAHIGLAIDGVSSPFLSHTVQGADESGSIGMINSDLLENVALLNGSYPQRYGNRTGAQVEMVLREGSRDRSHGRIAISGSSASIIGEGPMGSRGSWLLSARKSYLDLLIKQVSDDDNFAFGFSDLGGKIAWDATPRQKLDLSVIVGRSKLNANQLHVGVNNPLIAWNDAFLAVGGWHYAPGARLVLRQRVSVTGARYYSRSLQRVVLDEGKSLTAGWRADLTMVPSTRWAIDAGASVALSHDEAASRRVVEFGALAQLRQNAALDSTLAGAFAEARWSGPRASLLAAGGRVDRWTGSGDTTASPWLRGQLPLGADTDLVAGSGIYRQFPGFNEVAGLRGTPDLVPERAWHVDVGVSRKIGALLRGQAVFYWRGGYDGIHLPHDDWQIVQGELTPPSIDTRYVNTLTSRASGIELMLQRRSPNGLSGWLSYSYGTAREENRLTGERYDADFDQRHALAVFAQLRLSDRTALAVKLRTSTNFPIAGYVEALPATPERPGTGRRAGAVCRFRHEKRHATASVCPSRSARDANVHLHSKPADAVRRDDERHGENELANLGRVHHARWRDPPVREAVGSVRAVGGVARRVLMGGSGLLQPPFDARDPRGFNAVLRPELADGFGQIVPDCPLREVEFLSDISACFAVRGEPQHLPLAIGERIRFRPRLRRELGVDSTTAGVHAADRVGQPVRRCVLQQVSAGPRLERASQVAGAREGRQDDDAGSAAAMAQLRGQFQAGDARHLDVGHDNVRFERERGFERLRP